MYTKKQLQYYKDYEALVDTVKALRSPDLDQKQSLIGCLLGIAGYVAELSNENILLKLDNERLNESSIDLIAKKYFDSK